MEEAVVMWRARRATGVSLVLAVALLAGCGSRTVDVRGLQARVTAAHGRPLLVVFWATWCKPCVEEMPDLVALQKESPRGLRVLAVSLDGFLSGAKSVQVVDQFLHATPIALDHVVYSGTQDDLFSAFDLPGSIPYSILYDDSGRILQRFEGRAAPGEIHAALSGVAG